VPFIRYNRDKRGYESTFVMHAYRSPQGAQQTRVLYFFRSPSNLQVGRRALDEEVVEALEHMHPDLAFDWPALLRERGESRPEQRPPARWPGPASGRRTPGGRAETPAVQPVEVVVEDQSLLGRVLGAAEAGRLRRRFSETRQRIARRARTPEDRDQLSERAERLNPDEWADETAVREKAVTFDADLDAIADELPGRRRGRRGGRGRKPQAEPGTGADSAIMEDDGGRNAGDRQLSAADRVADAAGDGDGVGPDPPAAGAATTTDVP